MSTSDLNLSAMPDAGAFVDEAYCLVANQGAKDPGFKSHNDWVNARDREAGDPVRALCLLRRALRRIVGDKHPLFVSVHAAHTAARGSA
jgi:hypothetical protein